MDGVYVMLLPADAVGNEHVTLGYFGPSGGPTVTQFTAERMCQGLARMFPPVDTVVEAHRTFGPVEDRVEVADLSVTPLLGTMYATIADYVVSAYQFRPHITAVGRVRPLNAWVQLNRVALWMPEHRATWRLGSGEPCAS